MDENDPLVKAIVGMFFHITNKARQTRLKSNYIFFFYQSDSTDTITISILRVITV